MTLHIGTVELGAMPRIAAPICDQHLSDDVGAWRQLADLVELRFDRCSAPEPEAAVTFCSAARALERPLIATVRAVEEGGAAALDDAQRLAIFAAVLPLVDAIDIELHARVRDRVVALAKRHGKPVIVSHHDFEAMPSDRDLAALADTAARHGADVVKLTAQANSAHDTQRLLDFLRARHDRPTIAIAMGPHGVASRVFFPLLGSLITYGFVGQPGAPGQLALPEIYDELRRYSPAFADSHPARDS